LPHARKEIVTVKVRILKNLGIRNVLEIDLRCGDLMRRIRD